MAFAHEAEERFSRLLDALGIAWVYEPDTFPLEYGADGRLKSAFAPDFYLPALDLYVELTTQRVVTKKNRKMRLMAEQHPTINVVLLTNEHLRIVPFNL